MITVDSLREVERSDAQALADLAGQRIDISFAHSALRELLDHWPPGHAYGPDTTTARALWIAALVSYGRCFGKGVRTSDAARGLVEQLSSEDAATHENLLALRDKHIAHSVNAFEFGTVVVGLGPPPDFDVVEVKPFVAMTYLPDRQTAERFEQLVQDFMQQMLSKLNDVKGSVMQAVQGMSPNARGQLPALVVTPASANTDPKAARPRPTKRRQTRGDDEV